MADKFLFNPFVGTLDFVRVLTIQEVDGTPIGTPTTLKVSNGTLTDNGDGSFTLLTGGGGGGGGTEPTASGWWW